MGHSYTKHLSFYTKVFATNFISSKIYMFNIKYLSPSSPYQKYIVIFKKSDMYECYYRSVFYAADEKVSKCEIFIDNI